MALTKNPYNMAGVGWGTAATLNYGTSALNAVRLDASARLPAVDGSQLTGIAIGLISQGSINLATGGVSSVEWTGLDENTTHAILSVYRASFDNTAEDLYVQLGTTADGYIATDYEGYLIGASSAGAVGSQANPSSAFKLYDNPAASALPIVVSGQIEITRVQAELYNARWIFSRTGGASNTIACGAGSVDLGTNAVSKIKLMTAAGALFDSGYARLYTNRT